MSGVFYESEIRAYIFEGIPDSLKWNIIVIDVFFMTYMSFDINLIFVNQVQMLVTKPFTTFYHEGRGNKQGDSRPLGN